MITYAQNFEDVMLARIFDGRRTGFYVDVGAGDPTQLSVTKWFYDLGWNGINIEPNRALYDRLVRERSRDINLAVGAGAVRGNATFHEFAVRELSSFDPRVQKKAIAAGIPSEDRIVPIVPLNEILDEHAAGRHVDFLKIDVEGMERDVLNGLDLLRHRPTVIIVEATLPETRTESHLEWENILNGSDYTCIHFDGLNRFYLPRENLTLKKHFELPPNVFDEITTSQLVEAKAELNRLKTLNSTNETEIKKLSGIVSLKEAEINTLMGIISLKEGEIGRLNEVGVSAQALARELRASIETTLVEQDALRSKLSAREHSTAVLRDHLNRLAAATNRLGTTSNAQLDAEMNDEMARQTLMEAVRILRSRKELLRHTLAITVKPR